jgi:type II secretory pathway predicted ATPase ExeA
VKILLDVSPRLFRVDWMTYPCLFVIDEAQNLEPEVLEKLRLRSNFETSRAELS